MGADDIENRPQADAVSVVDKAQVEVGRENLHNTIRPHQSYEGGHRWDPDVSWAPEEEKRAVRKTDMMLLSWLCVMVSQTEASRRFTRDNADCRTQFFGLQLDRGNLSNALADTFLDDLHLTSDDYNNGNTIQLVCFMAAEFPVQFLTKRYVSSTAEHRPHTPRVHRPSPCHRVCG